MVRNGKEGLDAGSWAEAGKVAVPAQFAPVWSISWGRTVTANITAVDIDLPGRDEWLDCRKT